MQSFQELSSQFDGQFNKERFPNEPEELYAPCRYIISLGGKRIRPVSLLMGNELFSDIHPDAFHAANAIELFHNFSLIHDDMMDKAPLRRGMPTVPQKFGYNTALLSGDVMLVAAYDNLNKISRNYLREIMSLFNQTAREVCEGQQLDMNFEKVDEVSLEEYLKMITLKTSVLLGASLRIGAILGGAGIGNQHSVYEFGKYLGIAFQVQDDYLDAFGDPEKFGKQVGGDILANKKTFLIIQANRVATAAQKIELAKLMKTQGQDKINGVLQVFRDCKVDEWAKGLKEKYFGEATRQLEDVAVLSLRKKELEKLAGYLMDRNT